MNVNLSVIGAMQNVSNDTKPLFIGISGPSGSGKTALCSCLLRRFPEATLLMQDWYFKSPAELQEDMNFCDLSTLQTERFIADVISLNKGEVVHAPRMNLHTFEPMPGYQQISPKKIVLVEGMTVFRLPEIFNFFNLRIYLSPSQEILIQRKVARDTKGRGRSIQRAMKQLDEWIIPEYLRDKSTLETYVQFLNADGNEEEVCARVSQLLEELL